MTIIKAYWALSVQQVCAAHLKLNVINYCRLNLSREPAKQTEHVKNRSCALLGAGRETAITGQHMLDC